MAEPLDDAEIEAILAGIARSARSAVARVDAIKLLRQIQANAKDAPSAGREDPLAALDELDKVRRAKGRRRKSPPAAS